MKMVRAVKQTFMVLGGCWGIGARSKEELTFKLGTKEGSSKTNKQTKQNCNRKKKRLLSQQQVNLKGT